MDTTSWIIRNRLLTAIVSAVVVLIAALGAMVVTDQPVFCSGCHEMRPYYDTWRTSAHRTIGCTDCHVDPSVAGRALQRFPSPRQLAVHLSGQASFPLPAPPAVPFGRCTPCHAKLSAKTRRGFDHAAHAKDPCADCHAQTGHAMPVSALSTAGVYMSSTPQSGATTRTVPRPGEGAANIAGHKRVECGDCHDMGMMGCATCHAARHRNNANLGTDCRRCHQLGSGFTFKHPKAEQCSGCHTTPLDHAKSPTRDCMMCHNGARLTWDSTLMTEGCGKCHRIPATHAMPQETDCVQCHKGHGLSWVVTHPSNSSNCRGCHEPPTRNHPSGQCTQCHPRVGTTFRFNHPRVAAAPHGTAGITCTKCHPHDYSTFSCVCHK